MHKGAVSEPVPSAQAPRDDTANDRYLRAAVRAAKFIEENLYDAKSATADPSSGGRGKLLRRYRQSEAAIDGYVDDYAFFVQGLIDWSMR